jgi:CubicO group peptidase (beta-lactamase class C family)
MARLIGCRTAPAKGPRGGDADGKAYFGVMTRFFLCRSTIAAALIILNGCSPPADTQSAQTRTAAAATRGLDRRAMAAVVRQAEQLPRLRALLVARHGETLAEHRFRGSALDQPVNIKSASKSVLSALAGVAIQRGVLDGTEQKIAPVLRADIPTSADPRIEEIDVGDLLSMRAGLGRTSGPHYGAWVASPNWVRHALARPFEDEPGGGMIYSTGTSHLMSAVLTRASGRSTYDLAQEWLAEPLGIALPRWPQDPQGIYFGGNDMLLSPRALLRLGEMFRNGGVHQGRRVLSAAWVADSWRSRGGRSPWTGYTYGLGWWIRTAGAHPVYFAWGYGGQMLYVVPSLALTVVMTSDPAARGVDGHVQRLHAIIDQAIVPAAELGAG